MKRIMKCSLAVIKDRWDERLESLDAETAAFLVGVALYVAVLLCILAGWLFFKLIWGISVFECPLWFAALALPMAALGGLALLAEWLRGFHRDVRQKLENESA